MSWRCGDQKDELNQDALEQLENYLKERQRLLNKLIAENILEEDSSPDWIGILVGESIHPSLSEKRNNGYFYENIPIAALTLSRFKSDSNQVYVVTDTHFKPRKTNNRDQYEFNNEEYGKGRLVLAVVEHYVHTNPDVDLATLKKIFPKSLLGSYEVVTTLEDALHIQATKPKKRHFLKENEIIGLDTGSIVVCTEWGAHNIERFIAHCTTTLKYNITKR